MFTLNEADLIEVHPVNRSTYRHAPGSEYVHTHYLPLLGPASVVLWTNLASWGEVEIAAPQLAGMHGLGLKHLADAIERMSRWGMCTVSFGRMGLALDVPVALPDLNQARLERLHRQCPWTRPDEAEPAWAVAQ